MPLQATSGAASYDAFGGGVAVVPNYIEDVFSTWLYAGNGATQTITNGIDLAGKGGLTWIKGRSIAFSHYLHDTARGVGKELSTDTTAAQGTNGYLTAFNSNGFDLAAVGGVNSNGNTYASWTFRKQPKFFDVVTFTYTGTGQTVSHSLGSVPGVIIMKRTDATQDWLGSFRRDGYLPSDFGSMVALSINTTESAGGGSRLTDNTATVFTPQNVRGSNSGGTVNPVVGGTYVAYLFAHNAGGFGLTGTDNVISCGSFTTDGSGNATVTLGYEPQWVMVKSSSTTGGWYMFDTMREMSQTNSRWLLANTSAAEATGGGTPYLIPTATGFTANNSFFAASSTNIYIAIRRGPMKVPTDGTKVFAPVTYTGTDVDNRLVDTGIVTDMTMARIGRLTYTGGFYVADRLRGNASLGTTLTAVENTDADSFMTPTVGYGNSFSAMNGFGVGNDVTRYLNNTTGQLAYAFRRAPSFFDEICYTGDDGSARVVSHNLAALPQLAIMKSRTGATTNWSVLYDFTLSGGGANGRMLINGNGANSGAGVITGSTTTTLTLDAGYNAVGSTYVGWLFGNCTGVSKVGTYTGTGTTLQINCGFTAGARFVLIKRTSDTGDWYVWDSARGIISGDDPYILLNTTAASVTNTDYIDTYSAGFEISSTAPAEINGSGSAFIFLAIA